MRFNKENLLRYGIFIDNDFLDKYLELINNNEVEYIKYETAKHHVIPRCYYKKHKLTVDNTPLNIVRLYHKDHALAHYYLYFCLNDTYLKWSSAYSVQYTLGEKYFIDSPNYEEEANFIRCLDGYQQMMADAIRKYFADESIKIRCSKAASKRWSSSEERIKQRARLSGKVWVNKDGERALVDKDRVESYLANGYCRGTGYSLSEESRESIRNKLLGHMPTQEQIDKCRASRAGYTHTAETREKISNSLKGRKHSPVSEDTKRRMSMIMRGKCITGNIVECIETGDRYISIKSAASCIDVPEHVLTNSVASGIGICGLHYKIYTPEESKDIFKEECKESFIYEASEKRPYTTKSYIFMNKDNIVTRVPPNRVQDYIDAGWKQGRFPLSSDQRIRRKELYKNKVILKSGVKVMCIETGDVYNSKVLASKRTGISVYKIEMSMKNGVTYDGYTFRRVE